MADKASSLAKTKFIPRYGPGRAGFAVLQDTANLASSKNGRIWTDIDGTQRNLNLDGVITITANRTLLPQESGALVLFDSITALIATLPALSAGMEFTFLTKQIGAATGHNVRTAAGTVSTMKTKTSALTAAAQVANQAAKGIQNAGAGGGVLGDCITFKCDGAIWYGINVVGSWIQEP